MRKKQDKYYANYPFMNMYNRYNENPSFLPLSFRDRKVYDKRFSENKLPPSDFLPAPQPEPLPSPPPSPSYDSSSVVPASHLKDDPPLSPVSNKSDNTILWIVLIVLIGAILLIAAVILIPLLAPPLPNPNHSYISPTRAKTSVPTRTKAPNTTPTLNSVQIFAPTLTVSSYFYGNQCLEWDEVGLYHVGQTLCVYGTVRKAWLDQNQNAFFMTFGSNPNDFYMITYDGWYLEEVQNYCVKVTGEIMQLNGVPVMVVDPGDLSYCD